MNKLYVLIFALLPLFGCNRTQTDRSGNAGVVGFSEDSLMDRIKGGWAGQVIGCTFGGPTEFGFPGTMIPDYQPITWDSTRVRWYFENAPGLYDDVYMDLTFLEVMNREGIDAPATSHAKAFAGAPYPLWHANQAARYNILNGIMPPLSGHWKENPHADDIDFQIEADFAGLMSPGMPNAASAICDRIGHIMNYGDGWYGGVYMAALYSLAFVNTDISRVVRDALKVIPEESDFYRCIRDVIVAWENDPSDWKKAWFAVESKWAGEAGCPDGVFRPFNIDAKMNAAYVAIGLLYGNGDFGRTLQISARCGQDSDCNPASAGGILGTLLGYDRIPDYWKDPVKPVEDIPFAFTSLSLNEVYRISFSQACEIVRANGGKTENGNIRIIRQDPVPVRYEKSFEGHYPVERRRIGKLLDTALTIKFEGNGFVLTGYASGDNPDEIITLEMVLDKGQPEVIRMPVNSHDRRHEIAWKYALQEGAHTLVIKKLTTSGSHKVQAGDLIIYRSQGYQADL